MRLISKFLAGFLLVTQQPLFSQVEVGGWRDHFSYNSAMKIADAGDKIYCATSNGLFYYDKLDNNINKLTKVTPNGLSDVGITALNYSIDKKVLVIGYSNGNIDIVKDNSILNVSDIKRKQFSGNKIINNIEFINDKAYFACGFGIVVYNLTRNEFDESYIIGNNGNEINVFDVTANDSIIYASTENGVYKANMNNSLIDYHNWQVITDIPNFDHKFTSLGIFNNMLFVTYSNETLNGDSIYYNNGSIWLKLNLNSSTIYNLRILGDTLMVIADNQITVFNKNLQNIRQLSTSHPRDAVFVNGSGLWVADNSTGLVHFPDQREVSNFYPNGPVSNLAFSINSLSGRVYLCGGGYDASWTQLSSNGSYIPGELSCFRDGQWINAIFNQNNFVNVAIDPGNPDHLWAGSWDNGIVEIKNNIQFVQNFDATNSPLQDPLTYGNDHTRVKVAYDNQSNLWMANSIINNLLVRKTDNTWKVFSLGFFTGILGSLIVTSTNQKWCIMKGYGLVVFDDAGTIDDVSDDHYTQLNPINTVRNGVIDNSITNVYSIAEDNDGAIWVGTDHGIVVYSNPENVFGNGFYGQKPEVPRADTTSLIDFLLAQETITAIAVDGANRKWLGTANSGVFLVSDDGTKQIKSFNVENSPLVSNTITCIGIDGNSGEVFIGTDKGTVSYRDVATKGGENFGKVYVYPNPVRQNYTGQIIISGLIDQANVKITDIAGNIVYETIALGGQAAWNGKNFSGQRVSTGVYLVFSTNSDGSKTNVTKLLIIH